MTGARHSSALKERARLYGAALKPNVGLLYYTNSEGFHWRGEGTTEGRVMLCKALYAHSRRVWEKLHCLLQYVCLADREWAEARLKRLTIYSATGLYLTEATHFNALQSHTARSRSSRSFSQTNTPLSAGEKGPCISLPAGTFSASARRKASRMNIREF